MNFRISSTGQVIISRMKELRTDLALCFLSRDFATELLGTFQNFPTQESLSLRLRLNRHLRRYARFMEIILLDAYMCYTHIAKGYVLQNKKHTRAECACVSCLFARHIVFKTPHLSSEHEDKTRIFRAIPPLYDLPGTGGRFPHIPALLLPIWRGLHNIPAWRQWNIRISQ